MSEALDDYLSDMERGDEEEMSIRYKSCTGCVKFLPINDFSISNSRSDGLQSWCKQCNKNYQKNYNTDRVKRGFKHNE